MISICMATYNGEDYVGQQISSILSQIGDEDELVIIDDCSNDRTINIITGFNDPRIKIEINRKNIGPVLSFEKSIKKASGDIILLSDQDDVWMPDKVMRIMQEFSRDKQIHAVVHDAYIIENGKVNLETFFQFRYSSAGFTRNMIRNSYIGCCIAFRSELREKILPFPKNIPMHDQWIGMMAEVHGGSRFIEDRLILYRRHSNNVTAMNHGDLKSMLKKRFSLGIAIVSRIIGIS